MKPNLHKFVTLVLVAAAVAVVLLVKQRETRSVSEARTGPSSVAVVDKQASVPAAEPKPEVSTAAADSPESSDKATTRMAAHVGLPKLMDLGADKCIPCKKMAPILEAMRKDYAGQLDVVFIDVWKNHQAAEQHHIRLIPTQIFFDAQGHELYRHEGFFSREDILDKWKELGHVFTTPAKKKSDG